MFVKIKQKLCANVPKGAPKHKMCRQRTIQNRSSNDSQCELDFHAEANSQTLWKM